MSYAAHGAVRELKLGNNLYNHTLFNSRLQPTEIDLGTTQSGIDRLKLEYSYGTTANNGNVQSQTITVPTIGTATGYAVTQSYTYDELNRLKSTTEMSNSTQSWQQTFLYDRYGNRTFDAAQTSTGMVSSQLSINSATNQYVMPQGAIHYDNAGNLDTDYNGHTFSYDAENHQTKYDNGASVAGGATYAYDGDGRRVKKVTGVSLRTTILVYDAQGQMVAEYDTATPAGSGGTSYLTSDNLGTPRVITDANGNVQSRHDYAPFGEELSYNSGLNLRSVGQGYSVDNLRQKFTQKERDVETGLDYFGARYYASTQGRFTSPDEFAGGSDEFYEFHDLASQNPTFYADLTNPVTLNKYQYCNNNPLLYVDPDGHQGIVEWTNVIVNAPPPVQQILTDGVKDVGIGIGKSLANVPIGMGNTYAAFTGGEVTQPYQPTNRTQDAAMTITDHVLLLGSLLGGKGPSVGGVALADAEETSVVAADVGNAEGTGATAGRTGRQARLREVANDTKESSANRGWVKQEINQIERGKRSSIRNPPGKTLAHERGREAAKGYSYRYSNLQDIDLHKRQHRYDNFGRSNRERPVN